MSQKVTSSKDLLKQPKKQTTKTISPKKGDNGTGPVILDSAPNVVKPPRIRARGWVFTYNNPKKHDVTKDSIISYMDLLKVEKFIFQLECGENGTEHFQGCFYRDSAIDFCHLKNIDKNWHLEQCKSWKKSIAYCQKNETKVDGPWAKGVIINTLKKLESPRGWQIDLVNLLEPEPDKRSVYWIWEPKGNVGKSHIAVWLFDNKNATIVDGSKKDIAFALTVRDCFPKTVIFDIPRSNDEILLSWQTIEQLKNGLIFSTKYESKALRFNPPHVVVFSNKPPKTSKLSEDRWIIFTIENDKLSPYNPNNDKKIDKFVTELDW